MVYKWRDGGLRWKQSSYFNQSPLHTVNLSFLTAGLVGLKALCNPTYKARVVPSSKVDLVQSFHCAIRKEAKKVLKFNTKANIDKTPLPFTFTNGSTYKGKGAILVWVLRENAGISVLFSKSSLLMEFLELSRLLSLEGQGNESLFMRG